MAEGTADGLSPDVPEGTREVVKLPNESLPMFYANNVALKCSLWDFVLDFGLLHEATPQRIVYRDEVRVIMSPQHAKVFAQLLTDHINQYVDKFGPIPDAPPDEESNETKHSEG